MRIIADLGVGALSVRFSLVMPTLNAAAHIRDALDSVDRQRFSGDVEVIVADGGSHDATLDVARTSTHVRILDGGDTGIYDGFNRAAQAATGDLVGFLNADDWLEDETLARVAAASTTSTADVFSGHAVFSVTGGTTTLRQNRTPYSIEGGLFGIPAINARFFRREALDRLGAFDTQIGLAADRGFLLQMPLLGLRTEAIDAPLYRYRIHEGSSTISGTDEAHVRVLRAEIALMSHLLETDGMAPHCGVIKQCLALLQFKARRRRVAGEMPNDADHITVARLLGGLKRWYKWRGQLSGY